MRLGSGCRLARPCRRQVHDVIVCTCVCLVLGYRKGLARNIFCGSDRVVETIAMPWSMLAFRKLVHLNEQHRRIPLPSLPIRSARNMDNNRLLQYFDFLAATSKQRTIEKCHLTYRSKISIIIGFGGRCRSLNQIFPSLALHPCRRRWLCRHGFSALFFG